MKRAVGVFLLLFSFSASPSRAQGIPGIKPGDRVRVTSVECFQGVKLRFTSFSGDTLWTTSNNLNTGCPASQITQLEVFRATSISKASGLGLLIGTAGGAFIGGHSTAGDEGDCGDDCWLTGAMVGGVLGAGSGLVAGIILGVTKSHGRWEEIPLPPVQSYLQRTADGRFGFGFSITLRR